MRPCHLLLEGLRSYRDQAEIDFTRLDLTALIGDTGAGKSSIIEALTVALFNRPTFMGKNVSALRADGAPAMRVVLTFTVGDPAHRETWTVTRIHKANNTPSVHKLVCDETGEKVDGERRINDRIEELIGLNYDQFTRAVVIPQGQFAKLLEQTPAQRTETLKGIFRLDHLTDIKVHADGILKRFGKPVSEKRGQRDLLPKDPQGKAAEAEEDLRRSQERAAALGAAVQEADGHRATAAEAQKQSGQLTGAIERMREHLHPAGLGELEQATAAQADIDAALEGAVSRREAHTAGAANHRRLAAEALAPFTDRDRAVSATTVLGDAIKDVKRLAQVEADLTERRCTLEDPDLAAEREALQRLAAEARMVADETAAAHRTCETADQSAEADVKRLGGIAGPARAMVGTLEAALQATRVALDSAVEANALATVARDCRPGDDCPVCAQPLPAGFVPPTDSEIENARQNYLAALEQLEKAKTAAAAADQQVVDAQQLWEGCRAKTREANQAREEAEAAARTAGAKSEKAGNDHAAMVARLDEDAERLAIERRQIAQDLASIPEPYTAAHDDLAGLESAVTRLGAALQTAANHEGEAKAADNEARSAEADEKKAMARLEEEVRRPADDARREGALLTRAVGDLVALLDAGDRPLPPSPDRTAGPAEIAAWMKALHSESQNLGSEAGDLVGRHDAAITTAQAEISAITVRHGVADLAELRSACEGAKGAAVLAEHRRDEAFRDVARAATLDGFLTVGEPFVANLETLSQTLTSGKFIRALVEERERELLFDASKKLRELTGGNFGFGDGFKIVDRRTGQQRPPETLSGGERFLASLALALGLVEIATRGGGQLDALFLDEGFGSLDAGSLDQALSTLGNLAVGGRLVALISHLRRVAEHVDKVLLVERDEVLGSKIRELTPDERDELLAEDARSGLTA
jgi:DNA repair protein SbcC/Rad50